MNAADSIERLPQGLLRSLVLSVAASTFGYFWVAAALGVPLTMFMVRLEASGFQIGMLAAVMQFSVLAQLPSSALLDRVSSRKLCWVVPVIVHRLLWFTPVVLAVLSCSTHLRVWALIVVVGISSALAHSSTVPWFSWMADLVPEGISGRFWGIRQSVVMAAFVAGAAMAGLALDRYSGGASGDSMAGFILVFVMAAVSGVVDVAIHWFVPEPEYRHGSQRGTKLGQILDAWRDPDFRWFTLSMGVWMFAMGLTGSFGLVYMRQSFGASYSALSAMSVAASLGALCAGLPLGILIDRIGARSIAFSIMIAGPVIGLLPWFLVAPATVSATVSVAGISFPAWMRVFLPFNFLLGGLFSGVALSQIQLANVIAPRFGRLIPLATHWSIAGTLSALGPICGGLIMDSLIGRVLNARTPGGMPISYFHVLLVLQAALAATVAAAAMVRVRERGAGLPSGAVMSLLKAGNPLRLLTFFYQISIVKLVSREDTPK
jgi:MFS family permease